MSFQITTTVQWFLLPDDGVDAPAMFLQHLKDPYEMWIIAYSFTLAPMVDEIIANNSADGPIHTKGIVCDDKPEPWCVFEGVAVRVADVFAGIPATPRTSPGS